MMRPPFWRRAWQVWDKHRHPYPQNRKPMSHLMETRPSIQSLRSIPLQGEAPQSLEREKMKEWRNKETSHPRIVHGQRCLMPRLEWSAEEVQWEQGSGLKGPMSCGTTGCILKAWFQLVLTDQRTNRHSNQGTNGPIDQWTNRPKDQRINRWIKPLIELHVRN